MRIGHAILQSVRRRFVKASNGNAEDHHRRSAKTRTARCTATEGVVETIRNVRESFQFNKSPHYSKLPAHASVMEEIAVFTSKQKTKNGLQRFIDAGDDLKKVHQFNSSLNDTLLLVHVRLYDCRAAVLAFRLISPVTDGHHVWDR